MPIESEEKTYFYLFDEKTETIWEADGFTEIDADGKKQWKIILTCPKCHNNLTLDSKNKQIQVTSEGLETGEPIRCSHPGEFGPCMWNVELCPPKKRIEIPTETGTGLLIQCKIDAIIKQV